MTPKFWGIAAIGVVLALLAGYFFFWRPGQPHPVLTPIQEKIISELETANAKANKERENLKRQASEAAIRATQAQTEAAKARNRLRELEALYSEIKAKRGAIIIIPDDALKELKAMGWLR